MTQLSCEICMDLMPLVKDGVASEDSRAAVLAHIAGCPSCAALYGTDESEKPDRDRLWKKLSVSLHRFLGLVMVFGIFFGLSLTAGSDMFYNSILMPVIGALGYVIFRWKAVYWVPMLMALTNTVGCLIEFARGTDSVELISVFWWTAIYCLFVWLGIVIAWLLHFAHRKED